MGLIVSLVMNLSIGGKKEESVDDPVALDFQVFDTNEDGKLSKEELI